MSNIITFDNYRPGARTDGEPWTQARVEEAAAQAGPWTVIDTVALDPLDPDPRYPRARSFTADGATLLIGWYRVVFVDADGDEEPTDPVLFPSWLQRVRPTVAEIGALLRARTRSDATGAPIGTFTDATNPTGDQVEEFIDGALSEIRLRLPDDLPDRLVPFARRVISLSAAMDVEVSLDPERANSNDNAYARLKERYDTGLAALLATADDEGVIATPRAGSARMRSTLVDALPCGDPSTRLIE